MIARRSSESLFDRIVVVDWSANSTPKLGTDSIWMASVEHVDGRIDAEVENLATRRAALAAIGTTAQPGSRTLVGVDFSLGYPTGTAEAFGLAGTAWASTWQLLGSAISDDDRNINNRFDVARRLNATVSAGAGPFWGCPASRADERLTSTKPDPDSMWPPTWRHVERTLRAAGHRPFSAWQLHGAGSVGSQSLVGIAGVERLRWNLGDRLSIWPFTTGLRPPDATDIVVAEVWPSLWPVDVPVGTVKDAAEVESTAKRLATLDVRGELGRYFAPAVAADVCRDVVAEEGWVLGAESGETGRSA